MKDNFESCLKIVFKWEGGYSDHPEDPGGKTNYGITQERYSEYLKDIGVKDQPVSKISQDTARNIYKRYYWDVVNGDNRPLGVDLVIFDFAVNSGPSRAKKYATVVAKPGLSDTDFIKNYMAARESFLRGLKTFKTFGKGWINRTQDVRVKALQMAAVKVGEASATPTPEVKKSWLSRWFK